MTRDDPSLTDDEERGALRAWVDLPWEEHLLTPVPLARLRDPRDDAPDVDDPVPPGHVDSTTMAFARRTPWRDGDPCELCGEDETPEDPLGHFRRPGEFRGYVICHAQCGEDQELELA